MHSTPGPLRRLVKLLRLEGEYWLSRRMDPRFGRRWTSRTKVSRRSTLKGRLSDGILATGGLELDLKPVVGLTSLLRLSALSSQTSTSHSTSRPSKPLTYADAGVSIDSGNTFVQRIKPFVKSTLRPGADGTIGGFGGVFDLKAAGWGAEERTKDPVLVSGTDGVGTKLRVALDVGKHDTVGKPGISLAMLPL